MMLGNSPVSGLLAFGWGVYRCLFSGYVLFRCESDFLAKKIKIINPNYFPRSLSHRVAIYVKSRTEKVQSKLCSPALILIHAFFSVFMALIVIMDGRHSLGAALPWVIVCGLHYIVSPLALFTQLVAQSRELKKLRRDDNDNENDDDDGPGALSLRSFALQAAVIFVLAVRLIVRFGWGSFGGHSDEADKFARWQLILIYAYEFWQLDHVSWNYLVWVGGALLVWYKMVYNRKDLNGGDVDGERASLLE